MVNVFGVVYPTGFWGGEDGYEHIKAQFSRLLLFDKLEWIAWFGNEDDKWQKFTMFCEQLTLKLSVWKEELVNIVAYGGSYRDLDILPAFYMTTFIWPNHRWCLLDPDLHDSFMGGHNHFAEPTNDVERACSDIVSRCYYICTDYGDILAANETPNVHILLHTINKEHFDTCDVKERRA